VQQYRGFFGFGSEGAPLSFVRQLINFCNDYVDRTRKDVLAIARTCPSFNYEDGRFWQPMMSDLISAWV